MPISTLYASPANTSSDLFWAFQPKRATVPSLPLRFACPEIVRPARVMFGRPWIRIDLFISICAAWLARIARSGICSISPAPKTGVGIRKITLRRASSLSKSGCRSPQPGASDRPAMVKRSCTPPSGVPSALRTNRASRTGPFRATNDGMALVAPALFANAIWGFTGGLVPPTAGCRWQPPQLSRFIIGPRPSRTVSSSTKSSLPASKNASSLFISPAIAPPAPAAPPRTPGSLAGGDGSTGTEQATTRPATANAVTNSAPNVFITTPPFGQRKELRSAGGSTPRTFQAYSLITIDWTHVAGCHGRTARARGALGAPPHPVHGIPGPCPADPDPHDRQHRERARGDPPGGDRRRDPHVGRRAAGGRPSADGAVPGARHRR